MRVTELNLSSKSSTDVFVDSIQTFEDTAEAIRQLDVLKELLKAADRFYEESIRYAQLEARALVRIVEIGGEKEIKPANRRKAALWLSSHSESEVESLIGKCMDGLTITQVWKREIEDPEIYENAIKEAKRIRAKAFDDYKKRGIVHLVDVVEFAEKHMSKDDARDFYQGTRDRLIRNGAVGLDDGEYTYCDPEKTTEGLDRAIEVRVSSLCNDVIKLSKLMELAPYTKDIRLSNNGQNGWHDNVYAIMASLGKCRLTFSCEKAMDAFIDNLVDTIKTNSDIRGTISEPKERDQNIQEVADRLGITYDYARRQAKKDGMIA